MRTANNNFTVEGIVTKYRNYVKEHCPKSAESSEWQDKDGQWHYKEYGTPIHDAADEQLLITLYKKIKEHDADERVLSSLKKFADDYYRDALTADEIAFLCNHFSEVVSYEFSDRKWVGTSSGYSKPIPERLKWVKEMIKPVHGSSIFIADSGIGDIASLYEHCSVYGYSGFSGQGEYNNVAWALGQIRMCSAKIESHIKPWWNEEEDGILPLPNNGTMDFVIYGSMQYSEYNGLEALYNLLKPKGRMLLFLQKHEVLRDSSYRAFFKRIIAESSVEGIVSIIEDWWGQNNEAIWIVIDKSNNKDVRIVDKKGNVISVPSNQLDADILWPSYYLTNRPQIGIPLSELVYSSSYSDDYKEFKKVLHGKYEFENHNGIERMVLPDNILKMQIATSSDLSTEYKDANLCAKQLHKVSDPVFDQYRGQIRLIKNKCVLVVGNQSSEKKMGIGYVPVVPKEGMARYAGWACLFPKEGIDVRYVAAILLIPAVCDQILSICDTVSSWNLPLILDKIIVPNHTNEERLSFLAEANYDAMLSSQKEMEKAFDEKLALKKAEYINEVRMRKHDMRPHMKQLNSAKNLMQFYVENMATTENVQDHLKQQLFRFQDALGHLSDIIAHLSDEEEFGEPERFPIIKHLQELVSEYTRKGFSISFHYYEDDVRKFLMSKVLQWMDNPVEFGQKDENGDYPFPLHWSYTFISPLDFNRMVQNIIENAHKHGFTDPTRTDYEIWINLTIDEKREMYQVDFVNNGTPLPDGMSKARYGIKGEKAGLTGGTGSGGYIVKSIVTHYGGDYDVICKDGITTIRIYLPIATI